MAQSQRLRKCTFSHEQRTRRRAYELYLARGKNPGRALDDWLQAEEAVQAAEDCLVDEASLESFPASDPPAYNAA